MKKIIKLTESDLEKIVKRVLLEQKLTPTSQQKTDFRIKNPFGVKTNINPKNLEFGDGGQKSRNKRNDVIALQQQLIDLGLLKTRTGKPTGYFGNLTKKALDKYNDPNFKLPFAKSALDSRKTSNQSQTTSAGQSKITSKDPTDIKSYPACVRFGNPTNTSKGVYKLLNNLGVDYGQWQIAGKNFYEGYYFFNTGKYVSLLSNKTGTYTCNEKGKVILDIAAKASDPNTKKSGNYKYSPRIDAEVQHIKNRKMDDTPFLVYDPRENLIYLFDTGGVYITSSSVVDGADVQKGLSEAKAFTREDWCKVSGLASSPAFCTNTVVKSAAECSKQDPSKRPTWNGQFCKMDPSYGPIKNLTSRFLPKGIYTINGLSYDEGYTGGSKGGVKNKFGLKPIKLEGTITTAAEKGISAMIHGIPGSEERLIASKELEKVLRADVNSGKVPPQYLDSIQAILNANQSYGCIGVPASFVNNPKVQSIIASNVNKIKVFAMGEDSQDFLVKNDDNKQLGLGDYQSTIA